MQNQTLLSRVSRSGLGLSLALAAILAFAAPSAVHAGGIPFASFTTGSGTPFTFTNNGAGAGSGVGTLGAGTNTINFAFNADTGLSTLYYTATVSFTGTTTATTSPVNNGYTDQPINGATTDTITFTDVNSGHTLLAVTYTGDLHQDGRWYRVNPVHQRTGRWYGDLFLVLPLSQLHRRSIELPALPPRIG